ncbi:hypothetical protein F2Q68_00004241 [Brassica cretica]|uniref:Uncharacterized protein n=1 Tax=Brassica cretica TaxID=69181 RepID=A0A8S9JKJ0_BRACR|nr:hypothetical protein F2Q68_00004241 [Brassica cretica]
MGNLLHHLNAFQEESEEEFLEILQAYQTTTKRVVPRKEPCPSAGNTAAPPPAKEPEKMQTLHQGVLVFTASIHLEQRGVKEAGEHTFPLLFIHKKKPTLWVPGPSFQVPDPRFQIFGCSPCKEEAKNTCLSRFLREDATRRKVGANKLSVNPRGNTHQQIPSTCPWQKRFKMRRQVIEWHPENANPCVKQEKNHLILVIS